jgi:hypothetical protein
MTASSSSIFQADQTAGKFSTTSTDLIVQVVEISIGLLVWYISEKKDTGKNIRTTKKMINSLISNSNLGIKEYPDQSRAPGTRQPILHTVPVTAIRETWRTEGEAHDR